MSNNPSTTTKTIAFRLPNEICSILNRRAGKQKMLVSDYLRRRVIYDVCRSHKKRAVFDKLEL